MNEANGNIYKQNQDNSREAVPDADKDHYDAEQDGSKAANGNDNMSKIMPPFYEGVGVNVEGRYEAGDEAGYQQETQEYVALKFHVPVPIIIFLILVVALDLVCMTRFPKIISDYKVYALAEEKIQNGETSKAVNDLYALAEKRTDSTPIMIKLVDLSMQNGYYDIAGYTIDTYLAGKSLSDSDYDRINSYYLKLDNYYTTYDAVDKIFKNAPNQDTQDDTYYNEIRKQLKALLEQNDQDYAYIYYCLAMVEDDITVTRDDLLQCYDNDPECFDVRVQLSLLYRRLGDMNQAKKYIQEALHKDKQDYGVLRALATIALVEGDMESGLQYAQEAYNINADGTYIRDTYIIALFANGRTEDSKRIQEELTAQGQTLEEDTLQYLKGEITLKDLYVTE